MLRVTAISSTYPFNLALIWLVAGNLEAIVAAFLVIDELKPFLWCHGLELVAQVDWVWPVTLHALDFPPWD